MCVTPRIRCARCLAVIRCRCHVICLRVAFCHFIICISYHVIMCISFCIRVRLMHPSLFPVVRFAIRHTYVIRHPLLLSCCERVLNFLGMARGLPSGLGTAPVDRLSSFVPFEGRLILQRLSAQPETPLSLCSPTSLQSGPKPIQIPSILSVVRSRSRPKIVPHLDSPSSLYL